MSNRFFGLITIVAGGIGAVFAIAVESKCFDVPRVDGISIDGKAEDWQERGFRVDMLGNEVGRISTPENFDGRFRLGWDARGILVMVKVRDNLYFGGDQVVMTVATDPGADEFYKVTVQPGLHFAEPNMTVNMEDQRGGEWGADELVADAVETKESEGRYVVEAVLPWENLGVEAKEGVEFAFQLMVHDQDPSKDGYGHDHNAFWHDGGMYRVRLGSKPSDPSLRVACGFEASWLPRVKLVGPAELAGKAVEVREGQKVLARGKLELGDDSFGEDDRANAILKLGYPRPLEVSADLTVLVDGEAVATVVPPRPELPEM